MGTKHPNSQVLQRYTQLHKYWLYSLSAMNIVVDDCHLLGSFFFGGGGGGWILQNLISKLTLIIFHPFLPTSSRVLSFNFHINPSQPVAAVNHTRFLPVRKIDTWAIGFPQVILHMGNMWKLEPIGFPYVYSWLRSNLWETYGNIWKTHGTPMGKWWFWYSEPASCHRYSMCFPCISTGFPHVTSQLKLT